MSSKKTYVYLEENMNLSSALRELGPSATPDRVFFNTGEDGDCPQLVYKPKRRARQRRLEKKKPAP